MSQAKHSPLLLSAFQAQTLWPEGARLLGVYYGDERIVFEWRCRAEGVNKVLIKVHPDGRVEALAPREAAEHEVLAAVQKRGRWVYQQLRTFQAQQQYVLPRQYVSGESHFYLGKQYQLKVLVQPSVAQYVKLWRGHIEVSVRERSPQRVQRLLNEWYQGRARAVFADRLSAMLTQALWVAEPPPLRLLTMQTQWGSCSPAGRLTLNPHLVKAPRACIDYVILHELCHLAEHNHSERFYRLMSQVMPQWEKTKRQLDGMAHKLLNGSVPLCRHE